MRSTGQNSEIQKTRYLAPTTAVVQNTAAAVYTRSYICLYKRHSHQHPQLSSSPLLLHIRLVVFWYSVLALILQTYPRNSTSTGRPMSLSSGSLVIPGCNMCLQLERGAQKLVKREKSGETWLFKLLCQPEFTALKFSFLSPLLWKGSPLPYSRGENTFVVKT